MIYSKDAFTAWLKPKILSYKRYVGAVNTIAPYLYGMTDKLQIKTTITRIETTKQFITLNDKGHRMYSVALQHFLDFVEAN